MDDRDGLLARFGARNPLYIVSALLVLAGVYLILGPDRFFRTDQTLLLAAVLEGYQLLVLVTAAWIVRRFGFRFDAASLIAVEAVFLFDGPLFHASLGAVNPTQGVILSSCALLLSAIKILAFLHFSGLGSRVVKDHLGPCTSLILFLFLIHVGPGHVALWAHDSGYEAPWVGPQGILLVFALAFLPAFLGKTILTGGKTGTWILRATIVLAPALAILHMVTWAYVFIPDPESLPSALVVLGLGLALTAGPFIYLALQLVIGGKAGDEKPLVNLPWAALLFAGALMTFKSSLFPEDVVGLNFTRLAGLSGAAFFLAVRKVHPETPGALHASWIVTAGWAMGGSLDLFGHGGVTLVLLHVALGATLYRYRTSLVVMGASAASSVAWMLCLSGEGVLRMADLTPHFAGVQLAVILAILVSVLAPLRRVHLALLCAAALTAGFIEILRIDGILVEAAYVHLAASVGFVGVMRKEWPLFFSGILGTGAEGGYLLLPLLPTDARGVGILLLLGGFLLFASGFLLTLFVNRITTPGPGSDPYENGELAHEAQGARPD